MFENWGINQREPYEPIIVGLCELGNDIVNEGGTELLKRSVSLSDTLQTGSLRQIG